MLTRLFIDNFRCLVKFEFLSARKQLILGGNGVGKSSLQDALFFLRQFAMVGNPLDKSFILAQRTRWLSQSEQTFEIEALLGDTTYSYRVVIEPSGEPPIPRVSSEMVQANGELIFSFEDGTVQLFNDVPEATARYPFDSSRSAFATVTQQKDNLILTRFRSWLGQLLCFRINPCDMGSRAEAETLFPDLRLLGFAK